MHKRRMECPEEEDELFLLNLEIRKSFFSQVTFLDAELEKEYNILNKETTLIKEIITLVLSFLGYLYSFYIYRIFWQHYFFFLSLGLFVGSLVLKFILIYYHKQGTTLVSSSYHQIEVILSFLNLSINILTFAFLLNPSTEYLNSRDLELISQGSRFLNFQYFYFAIILFIRLEANILINFSYFMLNSCSIYFSKIFSQQPTSFIILLFLLLVIYSTLFLIKNDFAIQKRLLFAEKQKFKFYFQLYFDFFNNSNSFKINVKNRHKVFYNKTFKNFLIEKSLAVLESEWAFDNNIHNRTRDPSKKLKEIEANLNDPCVSKNLKYTNDFMKRLIFNPSITENNYRYKNNNYNSAKEENSENDIEELNSITLSPEKKLLSNKHKNFDSEKLTLYDIIQNKSKVKNSFFLSPQENRKKINNKTLASLSNKTLSNNNNSFNSTNSKFNKNNKPNDSTTNPLSNLVLSQQNAILNVNNKEMNRSSLANQSSYINLGIFYFESDDKKNKNVIRNSPGNNYNNNDFFLQLKNDEDEINNNLINEHNKHNNENQNGKDKNKNTFEKTCFEVYYKHLALDQENIIDSLIISDVTALVQYKENLIREYSSRLNHFAKIAHEFKTPINSVIGIASSIKDSELSLSNKSTSELETIKDLSNYLSFLISDIIQFSRVNDFSNICIQNNKVNLQENFYFCFRILNSLLSCNKNKKKNITADLIFIDDLDNLIVETDEIRLKQVLLNFISNAVKFTKKGKISLKTKIIFEENKIPFLKVSVKDTGIGIKERDMKGLLLEDYKIIENNLHNKINNCIGSGLGLSISKILCEKMNIKLNYKSIYMKGSSFSIFLPIKAFQPTKETNSEKKNISLSFESENRLNSDFTMKCKSNRNMPSLIFSSAENDDAKIFCRNINSHIKSCSKRHNSNQNLGNNFKGLKNQIFNFNSISLFYNSNLITSEKKYETNIFDIRSKASNKKANFADYTKRKETHGLKLKPKSSKKLIEQISAKNSTLTYKPHPVIVVENEEGINLNVFEKSHTKSTVINDNCPIVIDNMCYQCKSEYSSVTGISIPNLILNYQLMNDKHKIILIDDNEIINNSHRKIIDDILDKNISNYEIILGSDGLELIQIALNLENNYQLIDVILIDENMDYLNGSEAITFIRKLERIKNFKRTKIISLTSHKDKKIYDFLLKNGGDYVIPKPVTKTALSQVLEKFGFSY